MTSITGSGGIDGAYQTSPQHFTVEHAKLYPNVDIPKEWNGSFNFIEDIEYIEIKESIYQRAILVNIRCRDSSNILELCKISGDEKIELKLVQKIKDEGVDKTIDLELYISDIINYTKPAIASQSFTIQAVPKPAYQSQFITTNKSFSDSISGSITSLCNDIGIKGDMIDIESGGGISKGIYPNLKPLSAIKWLCRSALEGGPYFFWNTIQDGKPIWKFKSYDTLLKQEPIETFNNYPFFLTSEEGDSEYRRQVRKIQQISSQLNLSKYNSAPTGAFSSNQVNIDIATKNVEYKDFKYDESAARINKFAPFNKNGLISPSALKKDSRYFYTSSNSLAFDDSKYKNYHGMEYEHLQKTNSRLANLGFMSHDLTLMGNPDLSAGQMINLKLWKALNPEVHEGGEDLYMGGKYIITQLTHVFEKDKYSVKLKASKDSSAIDFDEKIEI